MPRKRHKPEEIAAKPRRVELLVSLGQPVADAVRGIGAYICGAFQPRPVVTSRAGIFQCLGRGNRRLK